MAHLEANCHRGLHSGNATVPNQVMASLSPKVATLRVWVTIGRTYNSTRKGIGNPDFDLFDMDIFRVDVAA